MLKEGACLKLLYVWIEKFRNITRQGFVVDKQYTISIDSPDVEQIIYTDSHGQEIQFNGALSGIYRTLYKRRITIEKNNEYIPMQHQAIQSISALVGENAAGKTSIMECLHMRADQFCCDNPEQRYYFLVFLDEKNNSIVIRTRDIWLIGEEYKRNHSIQNQGYEEYILPLENENSIGIQDNTLMLSIYQNHRQEAQWKYSVMGLPTIPLNLNEKNSQNSFMGVFDFLCAFPQLGGKENHLVFYLKDMDSRERSDYFVKENMTAQDYKSYFIYKAAALLLGELRRFLYHIEKKMTYSGTALKIPEEEQLKKEDLECAEILSFCSFDYPKSYTNSLEKAHREPYPMQRIHAALDFFSRSTYIRNAKATYNQYIQALRHLFLSLYKTPAQLFTALYKLEIPFEEKWRDIVVSFHECVKLMPEELHWFESVIIDFEWLSAGEYQLARMFSGLYQRLTETDEDLKERDLLLLFDEPEVHMHPETSRQFIKNIDRILEGFQSKKLINSCQLVLATHSPFIIQEISAYHNSIALVKKEKGIISIQDFVDLQELKLPNREGYSFNLVMYKIFGVPTVELHNELYGVLQEVTHKYFISKFDRWLEDHIPFKTQIHKKWIAEKEGKPQKPEKTMLQSFIRNSIHHPENRRNTPYTKDELRRSIDQMLELAKQFQ